MLWKEGCLAAGNYGGRISLLTCRKQNFKRLSPGSLTQTHTHTPPPCVCLLSLPPPWLLTHSLLQWTSSEQLQSVCVCVCVPPEATHWIVPMTSVASSSGPHLSSRSSRLHDPDHQKEGKGTPLRQDISLYIQVSLSSSKSSWWLLSDSVAIYLSSFPFWESSDAIWFSRDGSKDIRFGRSHSLITKTHNPSASCANIQVGNTCLRRLKCDPHYVDHFLKNHFWSTSKKSPWKLQSPLFFWVVHIWLPFCFTG